MSKPLVTKTNRVVVGFGWTDGITVEEFKAAMAENDIPGHATFEIRDEGNFFVIFEWKV